MRKLLVINRHYNPIYQRYSTQGHIVDLDNLNILKSTVRLTSETDDHLNTMQALYPKLDWIVCNVTKIADMQTVNIMQHEYRQGGMK